MGILAVGTAAQLLATLPDPVEFARGMRARLLDRERSSTDPAAIAELTTLALALRVAAGWGCWSGQRHRVIDVRDWAPLVAMRHLYAAASLCRPPRGVDGALPRADLAGAVCEEIARSFELLGNEAWAAGMAGADITLSPPADLGHLGSITHETAVRLVGELDDPGAFARGLAVRVTGPMRLGHVSAEPVDTTPLAELVTVADAFSEAGMSERWHASCRRSLDAGSRPTPLTALYEIWQSLDALGSFVRKPVRGEANDGLITSVAQARASVYGAHVRLLQGVHMPLGGAGTQPGATGPTTPPNPHRRL